VGIYQDVISGATSNRPELNRLMLVAAARKFDCLLVWKLDRFGRSLVDCLNNIHDLERNGIRFIAVTQGLDTDQKNPASRFLLHVLGAAAEFERSLIRERTQAGQARYRQDFESGKVGKTVASRSGRNLPPYRPRKIFDREEVLRLGARGGHIGKSRSPWDWGWGRSSGRCRRVPKVRSRQLEHTTACWLWRGGCRL
jgi:putative DNA-invertase from lambdoid prophage Rac